VSNICTRALFPGHYLLSTGEKYVGSGVLSGGIKRSGRDVDHSRPTDIDVKTEWSYAASPQNAFITWT
jgi:hypothetical protein